MRLVAAESLLLVGLLCLSAYVLWAFLSLEGAPQPGWAEALAEKLPQYVSRELVLTVGLCGALYWALQVLGRNNFSFWLIALLVVLPQGPAIWAHNQLQWFHLFGIEASLETTHSQIWQAALFLASLVGLVALYRAMGLRRLDRQLKSQRTDDTDRSRIILFEGLMLVAMIAVGLLLAFSMVVVANALGKLDALLKWSPWGVLTVGSGATLLLVMTLVLWFRYRESPE